MVNYLVGQKFELFVKFVVKPLDSGDLPPFMAEILLFLSFRVGLTRHAFHAQSRRRDRKI